MSPSFSCSKNSPDHLELIRKTDRAPAIGVVTTGGPKVIRASIGCRNAIPAGGVLEA
jgi:hypothetical protein